MIHQWMEAQRLRSAGMDAQRGEVRYGIVTSADPVRGAVRVNYQPSNALSGWLPVQMPWAGNGWGMLVMPTIGAQVVLTPVEGDAEHCVCLGVTYNDQDRPPSGYVADEFWLVHQSGSFLKLVSDGTVQIKGDLHVTGSIYSTQDVSDSHGALDRLRRNYNAHRDIDSHGDTAGLNDHQDQE